MKQLNLYINEKLVIHNNSKSAIYSLLSEDNIHYIQKVFRFYIENFLSEETVKNICKKGTIDEKRYNYTLTEINDIIENAQRENRSVASILFNNAFRDKDDVKQVKKIFDVIIKETNKSFIKQIKDELMDAFKTIKFR